MKRIFAFLLCLVMCASLLPVSARGEGADTGDEAAEDGEAAAGEVEQRTVEISGLEEFLSFAESCALSSFSENTVFELTADIALDGTDFDAIPYFDGVFNGNGHKITGLNISCDGSKQGLFRQTTAGAEINDLHVSGTVAPGGTACNVGGIVGLNEGRISGCSFTGSVSGITAVGGIAGSSGPNGEITGCAFSGTVSGEHRAGGIAGYNEGIVSGCSSSGSVNTVYITPRGDSSFSTYTLASRVYTDGSIDAEEEILNITDIGGIAGRNSGTVSGCSNTGDVGYTYTAYNVGGIARYSDGYIKDCGNTGAINGRKDVGGIVGQLAPYTDWQFSGSEYEQLQQDLTTLSGRLTRTSSDSSYLTSAMSSELAVLNEYTGRAIDALTDVLQQDAENDSGIINGIRIDEDGNIDTSGVDLSTVNTGALTSALTDLYGEMGIFLTYLDMTGTTLSSDLQSVTAQMQTVFNQLSATADAAGDIELDVTYDISVEQAYDRDIGAVDGCRSTGSVLAETCAGGIAGTVGFEVSFDMEDELDLNDYLTSEVRRNIFAVIRGCTASGDIKTKNDSAGGIAGRMDAGAAVDDIFTGSVASTGGDYAGGIAGECYGTASGCWARAAVSAGKYAGGIAGSGHNILNCRVYADITDNDELGGAVAGDADGSIEGNLYIPAKPAGIDGVSIAGQTDPAEYEELMALADAPDEFSSITVTFMAGDTVVSTVDVAFGGSIDSLPEVENDGSRVWHWDDFDSSRIYSSMVISGSYSSPVTSISTGGDIPMFLAQGEFYEGQTLTATEYRAEFPEWNVQSKYTLNVSGGTDSFTVRMHAEAPGRLYIAAKDGTIRESDYTKDGSYIVFSMQNGESVILLQKAGLSAKTGIIIGCAATAAIALTVFLVKRKKRGTI